MTDTHRDTIMRLMVEVGTGCAAVANQQMRDFYYVAMIGNGWAINGPSWQSTLILCFPKKFLKTEADPISATLIRYGVSKEGYEGLQVIHRTISGKEFDHGEQYKETEITTIYDLEKTLNLQVITIKASPCPE